MSLYFKPIYSKRRFVVGAYIKGMDGILRPSRPERCTSDDANDQCLIKFNGFRPRKTGTGHPIALNRCSTHKKSFGIYPHGCAPYSRRKNVEVSPGGFDIEGNFPDLTSWTDTSFGAAVDASELRIWPETWSEATNWRRKYGSEPYGVAKTQRRHIYGINNLFALTPDKLESQAKVVAVLGVDLSLIVQASGRVRDGPKIVAEGCKGAAVLRALGKSSRRLLPGITQLGFDCEYWGPQV